MNNIGNLILIITNFVLAVAAVIATILAYRTIQNTSKSRESELLNELLKEYSTKEMMDSIKILYDFQRNNRDVAQAYKNQYLYGNDLDLARRGISHYYQRISLLRRSEYVTDRFVRTACHADTRSYNIIMLLREIIIPIETAHAQKIRAQPYNKEVLEYLIKILDQKE